MRLRKRPGHFSRGVVRDLWLFRQDCRRAAGEDQVRRHTGDAKYSFQMTGAAGAGGVSVREPSVEPGGRLRVKDVPVSGSTEADQSSGAGVSRAVGTRGERPELAQISWQGRLHSSVGYAGDGVQHEYLCKIESVFSHFRQSCTLETTLR